MNLDSDEIEKKNQDISDEEKRVREIQKIAEMATLKTPEEENRPRYLSDSFLDFFGVVIRIPVIGEYLTSIIALIPVLILGIILFIPFILLVGDLPGDQIFYILVFIALFIFIPISYWWLKILEREVRLIVCLPIPIIQIPVKYILYPFVQPFFGIRYVFYKIIANK